MKTALVTGASSGIGFEICKKLLGLDYKVYGVSRNKPDLDLEFFQVDVTKTKELEDLKKNIKEPLDLLINCAGVGHFGQHEDLKPKDLEKMISTNLTAPIITTNIFLKDLKKQKGTVINITSITGKENAKFGAAYGATKAGLESFGKSLFDEVRKSGVRVVNIAPDITDTRFFDELMFRPEDSPEAKIEPQSVANGVEFILNQPEGTVITELTIRPQKILINKKPKL
ncbi:MAG: SDR family oxidoreductase [Campylobacterales bacterium]|nr:SDR family oxidoreductase [Campylobacterales bacterium]